MIQNQKAFLYGNSSFNDAKNASTLNATVKKNVSAEVFDAPLVNF